MSGSSSIIDSPIIPSAGELIPLIIAGLVFLVVAGFVIYRLAKWARRNSDLKDH